VSRVAPAVACASLLAACAGAPAPVEVEGKGLVTVDAEPPAGARTWNRPEWQVGDRFAYLRAGRIEIGVRVVSADESGYVLEDERNGVLLLLDRDLGELGERVPADSSRDRSRDPVDARLTWPLWVGKRWTCHFVQRHADGGGLPLLATYTCDTIEDVTVAAGTFRCLRIWRRTRPAIPGEFLDAHELMWYAPDVGWFVRRLGDGALTELVEFDRQAERSATGS
jgi:hypothetical protein